MKFILKLIGILLFFSVLGLVTFKLFFPDILSKLETKVGLRDQKKSEYIDDHELTIVYAEDLTSFSPFNYNTVDRARLLNIYEGLVRVDKTLNIEPAIAKTFGNLDKNIWEFILRPGIKFHDRTSLTMKDVMNALDKTKNENKSELASVLSTISEIKQINESTLQIKTIAPDPLFPNKIATVLIYPFEKEKEIQEKPIGTGPYQFLSYQKGKYLKLEAFSQYWGTLPRYKYLSINSIPLKETRFSELKEGRIDILATVPIDLVEKLKQFDGNIVTQPSMEVNFLIFNRNKEEGNIFSNPKLRQAITHAINRTDIVKFMSGYAVPSTQFVSRGVLGYDKDVTTATYDKEKAQSLVKEVEPFLRLKTTLDLVKGPEVFGDYLKRQLFDIGIDLELNFIEPDKFQNKMENRDSDFYFLGWRSEFGDSGDLFASVIHSKTKDGKYGKFNGTSFLDEELDQLIEESEKIIETEERNQALNKIMKKVVEEKIVGMPLFETQVIYGVKKNIDWKPRMDGYILASEVD